MARSSSRLDDTVSSQRIEGYRSSTDTTLDEAPARTRSSTETQENAQQMAFLERSELDALAAPSWVDAIDDAADSGPARAQSAPAEPTLETRGNRAELEAMRGAEVRSRRTQPAQTRPSASTPDPQKKVERDADDALEREIDEAIDRQLALEKEIEKELLEQEPLLRTIEEQSPRATELEAALGEPRDGTLPAHRSIPDSIFERVEVERDGERQTVGVLDADRDGRPEVERMYDPVTGKLASELVDTNYDGVLDTEVRFTDGKPTSARADADGDGTPDRFFTYEDGIASEVARPRDGAIVPLAPMIPPDPIAASLLRSDGLREVPAEGYFANTYVPGDPLRRWLQARLAGVVPGGLGFDPRGLAMAAVPIRQPFDAPKDAALAVYLHTDSARRPESGRMLVQVGIQATDRPAGVRSATHLAIVLDLRGELAPEVARQMRAVALEAVALREPGDHFHLVAVGRGDETAISGDDFRYGAVSIALDGWLREDAAASAPAAGDVERAVSRAIRQVREAGENGALGSASVLVVTPRALGSRDALTRAAHTASLAGVSVSTAAIGTNADGAELEAIALAGQGQRYVVTDDGEARSVIERELAAHGRVVARALRLRIRLQPGVRLLGVLDAERLDVGGRERAQQTERAIDGRLARELGIAADRGDDEDGIQILIPTFYAGDAHTILLDVRAERAGALADVRLRYKDVVNLRNAVANASLDVAAQTSARGPSADGGPLEDNVAKNWLRLEVSARLERAGDAVRRGDARAAASELAAARRQITIVRTQTPRLSGDPELAADERVLTAFSDALRTGDAVIDPVRQVWLADALVVASHRALSTPLEF